MKRKEMLLGRRIVSNNSEVEGRFMYQLMILMISYLVMPLIVIWKNLLDNRDLMRNKTPMKTMKIKLMMNIKGIMK